MKLKTGYRDYSADDLLHLGEKVATNLEGMPIFATLKPTAASIAAACANLSAAIDMVGPGRKEALETAFDALADLLAAVAMNAPQMAGVTDTELGKIDLPEVKTPTRTTTVPGICTNVRLHHGDLPGSIGGGCDRPGDNIRVYEIQWALDPNGPDWIDGEDFTNSRSFLLSGLPRGKDIWVRVRARNTVGAGPWSDPATIMVT